MNIAHQYAELVQFGGKPIWSEAIYELSEVIKRQQAEHVLIGDWGIEHQLILLSHNRLPMWAVPFASPEDPEALRAVVHALEQPNTILVRFASAELSPSPIQHELVDQAAHTSGHVLRLLHTIEDKQRRIIYHIYRVHPDQ
mgnify:CR=1 FL=1